MVQAESKDRHGAIIKFPALRATALAASPAQKYLISVNPRRNWWQGQRERRAGPAVRALGEICEIPVSPLDALWHFGNLFLPAWFVAGLAAALAKLLWRAELKSRSWRQLWLWGGAGGSLGLLLALALLGHDGKMMGYGLMLLAIALPQAWLSLRR